MNYLFLLRTESRAGETVGVLFINGSMIGFTIERPWKENEVGESCIPPGRYNVKRHRSPSKGDCFKIEDVPDRTDILIHSGNWASESRGCILPGLRVGFMQNSRAVMQSRAAMDLLFEMSDNDREKKIEIEIADMIEAVRPDNFRRVLPGREIAR